MTFAQKSATLPVMCGIVGYVGNRPGLSIVLDGLRRLEYRGYDSAGVAIIDGGVLRTDKRAGKLAKDDGTVNVITKEVRPLRLRKQAVKELPETTYGQSPYKFLKNLRRGRSQSRDWF